MSSSHTEGLKFAYKLITEDQEEAPPDARTALKGRLKRGEVTSNIKASERPTPFRVSAAGQ